MKRLVPFIIILLLFIPFLYAPSRIKNALIIVDVQNTFFDGGALEIKDNIDIISLINILRHNIEYFDIIVWDKISIDYYIYIIFKILYIEGFNKR